MGKPQVYALVKLPDGRIVKQPVSFKGTEKVERKMIKDVESNLWLYKHKLEYQDRKNQEEASWVLFKSSWHNMKSMLVITTIQQDSEKTKLARIIVALVTLLGIREEVYRMLR